MVGMSFDEMYSRAMRVNRKHIPRHIPSMAVSTIKLLNNKEYKMALALTELKDTSILSLIYYNPHDRTYFAVPYSSMRFSPFTVEVRQLKTIPSNMTILTDNPHSIRKLVSMIH